MMSWAMRSPSCSQSSSVARQLGALGVLGEHVAQQQRSRAATLRPDSSKSSRSAASWRRARSSAIDVDPSARVAP